MMINDDIFNVSEWDNKKFWEYSRPRSYFLHPLENDGKKYKKVENETTCFILLPDHRIGVFNNYQGNGILGRLTGDMWGISNVYLSFRILLDMSMGDITGYNQIIWKYDKPI